MAPADDREKRVSGAADRRGTLGAGGRRTADYLASQFSAIIPCPACRVAWASLTSAALEGAQPVAIYVCHRCGHREHRFGDA